MATLNTDILGISDLKLKGIGKFNSDDHYIYYRSQESLRRSTPHSKKIKKSLKHSIWAKPQKWQNDLCSLPRQTIQHHSNPSLWPNNWWQRSRLVLWRPIRLSRINTKKCHFHHGGWEWRSRKSRDTRDNILPSSTKWSRVKDNRVLPREHAGHSKHPFPATTVMILYMDITKWSILKSGWLYSFQLKKLYTVSKKQDLELTMAHNMSSLLENSGLKWRK